MEEQNFFNEVQVSFILREPKANKPTNIYLLCRVNRKQVKLSTGVKVYPEHWNEKKQEAYISCRLTELDNINNTVTNEKLAELKASFVEFKHYLCQNPSEIGQGVELLKQFIYKDTMAKNQQNINAIHWLRNTLFSDKTVKDSTRADYIKQVKYFEVFLTEVNKYPIGFDDIDLTLIKEYETYLFNKGVGKGNTTKTTTVGNKVEKIICILKRAEQQGLIDMHESKLDRYTKPKSRQGDENEIYLTEDEIDKMYALELTGTEEQVRDLFVLQCWTGQRFGDMQLLNNGIIRNISNLGKVIEIVQEKKTHKVSIPLFPITLEILDKYGKMLPSYTNQTALNYLKKIGQKAGITRLHNVIADRGGDIQTERIPAYECIGTHTARRSFICNMLKRGYDSHIIMKITGHNDEKSFRKYVKLTSEDAASLMLEREAGRQNNDNSEVLAPKVVSNKMKCNVNVLDHLFAETVLLKLFALHKQDIDIFDLAETKRVIKIIKDISTIDKVRGFLSTIDKKLLYERIGKLNSIVWVIARHNIDFTLIQHFQQKVIELELSDKIKEVSKTDDIDRIWSLEEFESE